MSRTSIGKRIAAARQRLLRPGSQAAKVWSLPDVQRREYLEWRDGNAATIAAIEATDGPGGAFDRLISGRLRPAPIPTRIAHIFPNPPGSPDDPPHVVYQLQLEQGRE